MSNTTGSNVASKPAWVEPTIEVVASVSDIATGDIDIDEDFTGNPLVS